MIKYWLDILLYSLKSFKLNPKAMLWEQKIGYHLVSIYKT